MRDTTALSERLEPAQMMSPFYWQLKRCTRNAENNQRVWHVESKYFFLVVISHEKIKGATHSLFWYCHVCRSTGMSRGMSLNLVSCGFPLPPSASNFFSELLPWVWLRKAFKGSEFVLSIDVLFQQRNIFQRQFHLKRFIDWIILLKGGPQKQKRIW